MNSILNDTSQSLSAFLTGIITDQHLLVKTSLSTLGYGPFGPIDW